jgi:ABC-type phosphate/phosphonate transport system substrate-binding protein
MYPFEHVRDAWDGLWRAVQPHVPWAPPELTWSGDVHERWGDPDCLVSHTCGWPLAAAHAHELVPVGAFSLAIPEAEGHCYRSTLIARRAGRAADFARPDVHAVANSADSLSGWVSLLHATVGPTGTWPGTVTYTSAHHDSLRLLRSGDADLASIDSLTLTYLRAVEPDLLDGLHVVGHGPLVPSPAITVRAGTPAARITELRAAFAAAVADRALADVVQRLFVAGFVALELDAYLPVLELSSNPVPSR